MQNKKWIQATDLLATALSCLPKTPINQAKLDRIVGMELYQCMVQVWASETANPFTADIAVLQQPQPFERLQNLRRLRICNADQSIAWKRILRGVSRLPQVRELTLSSTDPEPSAVFPTKEMVSLCDGVESMNLQRLSQQVIAQLPREMPNLHSLEINCEIDWQLLSQFHLPNLKKLRLHDLTGLRSLSQISQAFPHLEHLILSDVRTLDGLPLELGELSPSLYHLDLSVDELANWQRPALGITEMRIQNCSFDPSFLQNWHQLLVFELKNCFLEAPMPSLAGCKGMNYLIINGCAVTDFGFAKGLHELQVFNIDGNGVEISPTLEENQLPESLSCLAEMPQLLEFVIEKESMDILLQKCPKLFARYQTALPDMLRLKCKQSL